MVPSTLVTALTSLSANLQRARTSAEVFDRVSQELLPRGVHVIGVAVQGDMADVRYVCASPALQAFQRERGVTLEGLRGRFHSESPVARVVRSRTCIFEPNLRPWIARYLERALRHAGQSPELGEAVVPGFEQAIAAPLFVRDHVWGALILCATALDEADLPAVTLFAMHVSASLEVAESMNRLERRNRDLAAVHELATAVADSESGFTRELLRISTRATESDSGALYIVEPETGDFVMRGQPYGFSGPVSDTFLRYAKDDPLFTARGPWLFRELDDKTQEMIAGLGLRAFASVPLRADGRLIGYLRLARRKEEAYSDEDIHTAEIVGTQLVIQLERYRLFEEERRRVQQLSLLLNLTRTGTDASELSAAARRSLELVLHGFAAPVGVIFGAGEDEGVLVAQGATGVTPIPLHELERVVRMTSKERVAEVALAAVAPRPTLLLDANLDHLASAPMRMGDKFIGTLTLVRANAFSPDELHLLEACAMQVGSTLEHARSVELERRRARDLSLINELGALVAQEHELPAVLRAAVQHVARVVEVPDVVVLLLDKRESVLRSVAASLDADRFVDLEIPLDRPSVTAEAVLQKRTVLVQDAETNSLVDKDLRRRFGTQAILAIPLVSSSRAIGVIAVIETRVGRQFSPGQQERALAVANHVAAALARAQLFEHVRKSYEELARAQAELVKHERLAAVGELAAVMAHEVRNPLGAIFNSMGALKRLLPQNLDEDATLLLGILEEEAHRLNRLVTDLLDFVRPYEAVRRQVSMVPLVRSAVEAVLRSPGAMDAHVDVEVEDGLPPFPIDGDLMRQALVNLIMNATQATAKGGRVLVRVGLRRDQHAPSGVVEVIDQGAGVSPEDRTRIFQPFFTTKATGTGLGLAVVKRIVDAHQGEVEVRSEAGRGAVFALRLPLAL